MTKRTFSKFELPDRVGDGGGGATGLGAETAGSEGRAAAPKRAALTMASLVSPYKPSRDGIRQDVFLLKIAGDYQFNLSLEVILLDPVAHVSGSGKLESDEKFLVEDGTKTATPLWTRPSLTSHELHVHVLRRMMGPGGNQNRAHYFALEKPIVLVPGMPWRVSLKKENLSPDTVIQPGIASLGNLSFDVNAYYPKTDTGRTQIHFNVAATATHLIAKAASTPEPPVATLIRALERVVQPLPLVYPTDFEGYIASVRKNSTDPAELASMLKSIESAKKNQEERIRAAEQALVCRPAGPIPAPKTKKEEAAAAAAAVAAGPVPADGEAPAPSAAPAAAPVPSQQPFPARDIELPMPIYRIDVNRVPLNPKAAQIVDPLAFETERFVLPDPGLAPPRAGPDGLVNTMEVTMTAGPTPGSSTKWRSATGTSMELRANYAFLARQVRPFVKTIT